MPMHRAEGHDGQRLFPLVPLITNHDFTPGRFACPWKIRLSLMVAASMRTSSMLIFHLL